MKVLFPAIDGVFHSETWNAHHKKEIADGVLIDRKKTEDGNVSDKVLLSQ